MQYVAAEPIIRAKEVREYWRGDRLARTLDFVMPGLTRHPRRREWVAAVGEPLGASGDPVVSLIQLWSVFFSVTNRR